MDDLKLIKNKYGEKMMHLCREYFPTLLETPGLLFKLLSDNFAYNKFLYDDIVREKKKKAFKDYIYSLLKEEEKEEIVVDKTPQELLSEAGYILYECKTEEDIQKFKKYYAPGEELCTFNGGRLKRCLVFFAVKKNVEEIKRGNFKNPERQDEYGTSVISIQFTRGKENVLSIKNRYNHTVANPDATFGNNLDNIIKGLTASFEKEYSLNINKKNQQKFELTKYVRAVDGKYYKFNQEINNIYYCLDNIIIDQCEVIRDYEAKEKYLLFDYFILDLENKKVILYDQKIHDSFIDNFNNIRKIEIYKHKGTNNKKIYLYSETGNKQIIEINEYNQIIYYQNNNLYEIKDNFLHHNHTLENLYLPNVIRIGNDFLHYNCSKINLYLPQVMSIGNNFLFVNRVIDVVEFNELEMVGNKFLRSAEPHKVNLPKLKIAGSYFMASNDRLKEIDFQSLIEVGDNFFSFNYGISKVSLPKLKIAGHNFLSCNRNIEEIDFPRLIRVGDDFIKVNTILNKVNLPRLKYVGQYFLSWNENFKTTTKTTPFKKIKIKKIDEVKH